MPGSIHVSVLEAFDLPETIADGEDVAIKVAVGTREYQTVPSKAVGGKTAPWSLDFVFPVLNLRDNLLVILLDENGEAISRSEIDTPSIVEQGSFDVNLLLNGGGNVHLSLSFVLTEEERRRIDVMRAAALKRREQEALKISESMQSVPVEGKVEVRSSELHSTPAASLGKDIEKVGVAKESSTTASRAADNSQFVPVSQAIHEQSLICVEPKGQLDDVTSEEPETNLHGTVEGASEQFPNPSDRGGKNNKFTRVDNGNQEPTEIADLAMVDNSSQTSVEQMAQRNFDFLDSSTVLETDSEDQKIADLDTSDMPQPDLEENEFVEDPPNTNLKPTSSSVKAKVKAFEKTRPQGATKQNHILSPGSKIQKFSPQNKTTSRKKVEGDAQQIAKVNEPLHESEIRRTKNEPLEPANQMKVAELYKNVLMGTVAALETSEAGHTEKEENCLFEIPTKRPEDDGLQHISSMDNVELNGRNFEEKRTSIAAQKGFFSGEPAQNVDTTGIQDSNLRYQAAKAEQPKHDEIKSSAMRKSKNINLVGLSKQVLSGAVSGAVLIACVALLWAVNPRKRSSSLQQRSKQRKRK